MKLDMLAIGAHPDDAELSCSGTLLKHISLGYTVGLIDLTRGELGTRGTPEIRKQEAENAAKKMQAKVRLNLEMPDGFFNHSQENLLKVVSAIRRFQPEIVLANALSDRHPDHGKGAKLTAEACFLSGLHKIVTTGDDGTKQDVWRPKIVLHYIQDYHLKPDVVVDITPFMEKKMELVMAFKSQFYDPNSPEPESPISSKGFLDSLYAKARIFGRPAGVEYAEGFQIQRTFGVNSLFDLY